MENSDNEPVAAHIISGRLTGARHAARGEACEDVIYCSETPELVFCGLADGQSGRRHCREGAEAALQSIERYLHGRKIPALMRYEHKDEIQYEIIRGIRAGIMRLAEKKAVNKEELSSTILVFALHPPTGTYITIHLGDGVMIGRRRDTFLHILSAPENGVTARYTWLTTSDDALMHLRISFGNVRDYDRIFLFTDGASAVCRGRNISREGVRMLGRSGNAEEIMEYIRRSEPVDDAGYILIDLQVTLP